MKPPTAVPVNIDKISPPEKRKPPTAGTLDIDEMGLIEKRKPFPCGLANIDEFINSLIVPDDFILDESVLGLIHIKGVDIKHILSVKVLRKIWERFKVSENRNGKKDFSISLIICLLKETGWLVNYTLL